MERNSSVENDGVRKRKATGAAVMQPSVTHALRRALFEEWAARGYAAISLEAVAARAGVGKAALYRRWPSKPAMAADALTTIGVTITDAPDTGSLEGDVRALLKSLRRVLRHPLVRRIVPDLHAETGRSRELAAIADRLTVERRARGSDVVLRAIARGELDECTDVELAADLVAAPIYWRLIVTRGKADEAYLERLVAVTVAALRACSRRPSG